MQATPIVSQGFFIRVGELLRLSERGFMDCVDAMEDDQVATAATAATAFSYTLLNGKRP